MKSQYKYYRVLYSAFATITLALLLWCQFTIHSFVLWHVPVAESILSLLTASAGLLIMLICIKKYFYNLSGIDVFIKRKTPVTLEQKGLHQVVRHPLYSGTLLFVWSAFLYYPILANLIACICITIYTRTGIYFEEKKLREEFGNEYENYTKKVPMLFPDFFGG